MKPISLYLLLQVAWVPAAWSQASNPAKESVDKGEMDTNWDPTHPDGESPAERMLSLAHTDALPGFDRAELYAVSLPKRDPFSDQDSRRESSAQSFPVRPYGVHADIHAHVSITGGDCARIRRAWQSLSFDRLGGAFCHTPAYGMRLYRDDALLFETTICWECQNFYVPRYDAQKRQISHGWYGFANDDHAKALLKLFQSLLPHS
ncbi:hypothetical protein [Stieleria mannarensis]|uniref:hypothetical protein n=1 Tax=Stieleria mannarensis TaxID=2755585 RepID=UPI0016003849|nr:hypothetical protein [Rhodopirellula sp. JC639]